MQIAAVKLADFEAMAVRDGASVQLRLKGDASGDVLEPLERLLADIHDNATSHTTTEATVDIRDLEFMSSSCFKCFVTWVTDIQGLDEAKQYRLVFQANSAHGWQKRSLRSLHCFATELVKIDE